MNSRKKLIAGGVVAGGLMLGAAGLVIGAGIAKADTSGYLTALQRDGIPYSSRSVEVGYKVCGLMRGGLSEATTVSVIAEHMHLSRWFVSTVVADAHMYLCPDALVSS